MTANTSVDRPDEVGTARESDDLLTAPSDQLGRSFATADHLAARRIVQPVKRFLRTETAGGFVLVLAAIIALVWANSPFEAGYRALFATELGIDLGFVAIQHGLDLWINDLLMAVFFFVAGLEIKRELVSGDLRDPRSAALPILCAFGGMAVPAALYYAVNARGPGSSGWGIPMATDIAFAVGVLVLVGKRAPASLKVFLLTLAIVDDIGAIIVIAIFYSTSLDAAWLALAAATIGGVLLLRSLRVNAIVPYFALAGVLWLSIYEAGVNPTIAGVTLGLLTPALPLHRPRAVTETIHHRLQKLRARPTEERSDDVEQAELAAVTVLAHDGVSPLQLWTDRLHPWSAFVILPLFALANAGVNLSGGSLSAVLTEPVPLGVILGLVLGKPVGVMVAAFVATKLGLATLPRGVGWLELGGVGLLAGVGFTVSIFIAGLAFTDPVLVDQAKVGILAASITAGLLGYAALAVRTTTD